MRRSTTGTVVALSALALLALTLPVSSAPKNYHANLSGGNEVPPVVTNAHGNITLQLNSDGTELSYRLIVANIENVRAAHIHSGAEGVNGPVVVTLYGGPEIEGKTQGILAEGTITAADLSGPLLGASLSDLIALIDAGNAYVNAHTTQNPGGEIRGQLE